MFEYQGWATIKASYYENDDIEDAFDDVAALLSAAFARLPKSNLETGMKYFNGMLRFWVLGCSNHKPPEWAEYLNFFQLLASRAPGSYGMLSCRDDEDQNGRENQFQLFILKKGKLEEQDDNLLSPCVPVIEEL
jgi:hypothetical protein